MFRSSVINLLDFPGGTVARNPPANVGDQSLVQEDPTCWGETKARVPTA